VNTAAFWFLLNLSFFTKKGENSAQRFFVLSDYSDLASDVVDFRVQKDYNLLISILIGGLEVCTN
jgi:hypothetical protein